ncbi:murein L,D-transpeptidase family protein [Rugamonas sp. DEMB1]|uniref:L,D-transpeptidase family protein n=1 Tax=Rugamonas sp. DEMB1 TaxID=3039386 RepID=UPI00244D15E0|nr:L,D-transpeptidase family protein [Rugamonas sp. DEMB1]WGG50774.1 L,D-transpeptidase family protein [Rugamonas sp. DEMB1]
MSHLRFPQRWRTAGLLCLVLGASLAGGASDAARKHAPAPVARKANPEELLSEIYRELSQNNLREAQRKADSLVEAYPNFRLGHLVRGDLLLMHTRPVSTFGAAAPRDAEGRLDDLRREAAVRLRASPGRPAETLLPRALLQMRKDQRHALIVDAKHSRLYLYENKNDQIRLLSDFYVSQGKLGVNKLKEGDMRTPVGVYYIVGRLAGFKLPDMYGKGALPLDYPNEWDKLNGRGGSGIWVHGTPPETFSRAPLSTDGCVVVSNDDLNTLSRTVQIGSTPVLIGEQVEFVSREVMASDRKVASELVENWRRDMERRDDASVLTHYSRHFKAAGDESATAWLARQQFLPGARLVRVMVSEPSYFRQPSREEIIVSSFTQQTVVGKYRHAVRKRQYWAKEGRDWKIVAESNV